MRRDETVEILRFAGWSEGRKVPEQVAAWDAELTEKGGFVLNDAARAFLLEFGGLAWPTREPGEHLPSFSFNIDPRAAVFEDDRFEEAAADAGESLFPVGEVVNGHAFLAVGPSGQFYLVMDDVQRLGNDPWNVFDQMLSNR